MTAVVPTDLARALSERYEVRDLLGRGGMATVYVAYDRKHHRDVALKVMRPDIAATIGADRFLKEIQIVARMVHPHILSLHDSGEAEEFLYYVMPFIDGGNLRDRVGKDKKMPADRAIAIAEPIADALAYAHQCGVLHRDIKPENVLFTRNHPIVADFGIAKAVSSASDGIALTRTGISLGTPGYMSPEQAAGFTDVDARTDVYALAILVYEMIVGEIPGRWVSDDSVREGRFLDTNPLHRQPLSAAGPTLEAALVRALALRPDQRTATPGAFIEELKGIAKQGRRKYRPDEIEAIVNRAAELEVAHPTSSGAMTIGGVEQIARDVGIPADLVRKAERSLSPRAQSREATLEAPKDNFWAGGPTRALYERVVDGELDERDYSEMVDEIRRCVKEVGQVSQLGRSFSWVLNKGQSGMRNIEIVVSIRPGKTRILVQENFNNLLGAIYGGVGGGMGGGGMAPMLGVMFGAFNLPGIAASFIVPAWLLIVGATARTSYHYAVKRREKALKELADRLASLASELIDEQPKRLFP
ncbi:MAG TPA: serine/threonine-protein kinase [Gemmatimonadaceae bacterium]|nr:serine/threonine-protein kinase [Gemmatimonadaceae bacterium]